MTYHTGTEVPAPPSRRTVLLVTSGAVVLALILLFAGVLPAEFNRDPTRLGKLIGTDRLWAPEEQVVPARPAGATGAPVSRSYPTPFRSDVIEVSLKVSGDPDRGDEVEYKVQLDQGASYVYSWELTGIANPEEFYTEFHGHTVEANRAMTVTYYRKATGISDNGVLTAPFSGVHGWFFQNQSEKPVTVRLRLSGFYTLIPAGKPGNEAGLAAKRVTF